jgi:DMSO reductase family type II enzyme chaperone
LAEAQLLRVPEPRADSAARSELYRVLSAVFRHPDPAAPFPGRALGAVAAALPYRLPEMTLPELPLAELQLRYTNLFEASDRSGAISLHESDFVPTPRAKVWEDVVRFYEHFGLRYDGEAIRLWPDHLAIELECLQYLSFLEAGIAGDIAPLLRAERDFIDRHLLPWLPDLAGQLAEREEAEPWPALVVLLQDCLRAERGWLERATD